MSNNQLNKIWLSSPHMGEEELKNVQEAFETNWIAPLGPHVNDFEKDLQTYTGVDHAAVLSSGTAALHLALVILGVKFGDQVICQSFTFCASVNPILYQGATPIFIDSELDTWNISPQFLEEAIKDCIKKGKKPKAIVYVHLYGMPAKIEEIQTIAKEYGIPLIEDAAEALGATYKSKKLGGFSDISILSFNGNKIITTSGGGALLSDNEDYVKKARFLATQARDSAPHYEHTQIGYNYRMSNICAAIGRGQMKVLEKRIEQRRKVFARYKEFFQNIPWVSFCEESQNVLSNRWLTTILIKPDNPLKMTPQYLRTELEKENIESRPLWKPMHLQPIFKSYPYFGNGTSDHLFETGLCLPSGSNLMDNDFNRIFSSLESTFY